MARNGGQLLPDGKHPVVALIAFISAFLFAGFPFAVDPDSFLIVAFGVIGCFSVTILFIRLLIGELGRVKWILLGMAGYLCVIAGHQWYLIVLLTVGTVLCSFVISRLLGSFKPLVRK